MNIKEAKQQIKNAMISYFAKDEFGEYRIPVERQRPVFMMGPSGIGKTAIMEQIAQELGVGLVSYSMTHHTRQSALGLPFIVKKSYGGKEYSVSEYTMSEIIASVYDMMEESGLKEGILFLDEINCVSETLAPSMLQFLQYKTFGRHQVPEGWIVVTAGNPPEYNSSAREFDIVTWDRMKRLDIEPDYPAWKEYAYMRGTHPAVMSYLEIKQDDFYKIETTVDGKSFVTARGWSDLSDMIYLYEDKGLPVDGKLISQYLQNRKIARDFSLYYELFKKYRSDYEVEAILDGKPSAEVKERARTAKFDERLSLLGLLLDGCGSAVKTVWSEEYSTAELIETIKSLKGSLREKPYTIAIEEETEKLRKRLRTGRNTGSMSLDEQYALNRAIAFIGETRDLLTKRGGTADGKEAYNELAFAFDKRTVGLTSLANAAKDKLANVFTFCEDVFGDGQEMLILVTELTVNYYSAQFINRHGCDKYFAHNKSLMFYERQKELINEIEQLGKDEE